MSQFWHSHWAEDAYKPYLLGNWEVPNWHPKWPCKRHCVTTTFLADNSGRLLPDKRRPKASPWGDYKGTWQLPSRIDRNMAKKLSEPPKHKIAAWQAHKKRHEAACSAASSSAEKKVATVPGGKTAETEKENDTKPDVGDAKTTEQN